MVASHYSYVISEHGDLWMVQTLHQHEVAGSMGDLQVEQAAVIRRKTASSTCDLTNGV
jgi:hypothetical protein